MPSTRCGEGKSPAATVDQLSVGRITSLLRLQGCRDYAPIDCDRLSADLKALGAASSPGQAHVFREEVRRLWSAVGRKLRRGRGRSRSRRRRGRAASCGRDSSLSSRRGASGHRKARHRSRSCSHSPVPLVQHGAKPSRSRSAQQSPLVGDDRARGEARKGGSPTWSGGSESGETSSQNKGVARRRRCGSSGAAADQCRTLRSMRQECLDSRPVAPLVSSRLQLDTKDPLRERRNVGDACRHSGSMDHVSRECSRYEAGRLNAGW